MRSATSFFDKTTARSDLRRHIGLVLQEPFLFSQTIGENIRAVRPDAPEDAMRRAAAIACVDEAICEFPEGYETLVGERGVTLSGGQKQRVAIAGVIAMRPRCIVLDEPTAMLDPHGREEVISTIERLNREMGITVVLITHHMTEAIRAQRVIVMDTGRILADGTPKEVFPQVELLESVGLTVPATTKVLYALNQAGFDLPLDALSTEECAQVLLAAIRAKT